MNDESISVQPASVRSHSISIVIQWQSVVIWWNLHKKKDYGDTITYYWMQKVTDEEQKKWWREDLRQVISLLSYLSRSILQALDGKQLARALNGDESSFIIVLPGFLLHPHPHPPSSPNKTRPFIFHLSEGFEWQLNCIYEKSCGDPPETN